MKIGMVITEEDVKKIVARYFRIEFDKITYFDMKEHNIMFNYDDDEKPITAKPIDKA